VEKAVAVHGDKYDYSETEYVNRNTVVFVLCPTHGGFYQRPSVHLLGHGCQLCRKDKQSRETTKLQQTFISDAIRTHGLLYDYSDVDYTGTHSKITIICKAHGQFAQQPYAHLGGAGCPACKPNHQSTAQQNFVDKARMVHNYKYKYDSVKYKNNRTKVLIHCPSHGSFAQSPASHLRGSGCPTCAKSNISSASSDWLNSVATSTGCWIQHGGNVGEFRIPGTKYKADGYCKETNTIFEFHGDKWHGNLDILPNDAKCHPKDSNITAIELYQKTKAREQEIVKLGYNLVVMWEHDWKMLSKTK
jgi:hypothetical protein